MANVLTGNVWYVDSGGRLTADVVVLKGISWVGATTAGHQVHLGGADCSTKWRSVANAANYVERDGPNLACGGLEVTRLDSGILYLELA